MEKKKHKDLPQILVLKRTFIQRFPNGQQVALYHSDLLDQYITVPLDGSKFSNTTESVYNTLLAISESDSVKNIKFEDDSELNINKECADVILQFLDNQEELIEQLALSDKSFLEILEQAVQTKNFSETETEINQQELD